MQGFYRLKQENDVSICWQRVTSRCKKYDADCTMTPLATKNRRSICTRATDSKFFDKLSRAISVKHTSYNWRNAEATYLVLLTGYSSFDIQRNLFHCKIYFAWCKISVCFSLFVICTIADSSKVLIQIKNFNKVLKLFSITCHSKNAW